MHVKTDRVSADQAAELDDGLEEVLLASSVLFRLENETDLRLSCPLHHDFEEALSHVRHAWDGVVVLKIEFCHQLVILIESWTGTNGSSARSRHPLVRQGVAEATGSGDSPRSGPGRG